MTGFLSRLAARNLGLTEAVRPSLPSLLTGGGGSPPIMGESTPQEGLVESAGERTVPLDTGKLQGVHLLDVSAPGRPTSKVEERDAIKKAVAPDAPGISKTKKETAMEEEVQAPSPLKLGASLKTPPVIRREAFPRTAAGFRELSGEHGPQKNAAESNSAGPRMETAAEKTARPGPAPDPTLSIRPQNLEFRFPEKPAGRTTDRASIFSPSPGSMQMSEPPAIKVHIGRIEVRAVMSPPPPGKKEQPAAHPAMTLGEYLKRKDRGRT